MRSRLGSVRRPMSETVSGHLGNGDPVAIEVEFRSAHRHDPEVENLFGQRPVENHDALRERVELLRSSAVLDGDRARGDREHSEAEGQYPDHCPTPGSRLTSASAIASASEATESAPPKVQTGPASAKRPCLTKGMKDQSCVL